MRKNGCTTSAKCWELDVINCDKTLYKNSYATLKEIADDLGMTYNQVVELSSGRKKQPKGKYDTKYIFKKIVAEKLNKKNKDIQVLDIPQESAPASVVVN
jgi:hypothetical protein